MFVVTFYSYKGGVGRTMALANVATLLAKRGKRVLVVDFDLEAPTLPSYECFGDVKSDVGLVDYLNEYRETGVAPNISDYLYKCSFNGHELWLLPAGNSTETSYTQKLEQIDWQKLYSEQMGYLLFEDMKQQWQSFQENGFDYVLIDSRTGHTDVGGICTRQLPNLVVPMFMPTRQNIAGLAPIIQTIRNQSAVRKKPIELAFCASNVPHLDDEQEILSGLLNEASSELQFDLREMSTLHHYDSLGILSQEIFCAKRPNSRLAREYETLSKTITSFNWEDEEGAKTTLNKINKGLRQRRGSQIPRFSGEVEAQIGQIYSLHKDDPEVSFLAAAAWSQFGNVKKEITALTQAAKFGEDKSKLKLQLARALQSAGRVSESSAQLREVLLEPGLRSFEASASLRMLDNADYSFQDIVSEILENRDTEIELLSVVSEYALRQNGDVQLLVSRMWDFFEDRSISEPDASYSDSNLILALIRTRRFEDAIRVISNHDDRIAADMVDPFNLFIAKWGRDRVPDERIVQEIILTAIADGDLDDPNYLQCMGLWYAVIGEKSNALELFERAIEMALHQKFIFSCFSYLHLSTEEFREDTRRAIQTILRNEALEPFFFSEP